MLLWLLTKKLVSLIKTENKIVLCFMLPLDLKKINPKDFISAKHQPKVKGTLIDCPNFCLSFFL